MFKIKESNITKNHEIPLHKLQAKYFAKALKKTFSSSYVASKIARKKSFVTYLTQKKKQQKKKIQQNKSM